MFPHTAGTSWISLSSLSNIDSDLENVDVCLPFGSTYEGAIPPALMQIFNEMQMRDLEECGYDASEVAPVLEALEKENSTRYKEENQIRATNFSQSTLPSRNDLVSAFSPDRPSFPDDPRNEISRNLLEEAIPSFSLLEISSRSVSVIPPDFANSYDLRQLTNANIPAVSLDSYAVLPTHPTHSSFERIEGYNMCSPAIKRQFKEFLDSLQPQNREYPYEVTIVGDSDSRELGKYCESFNIRATSYFFPADFTEVFPGRKLPFCDVLLFPLSAASIRPDVFQNFLSCLRIGGICMGVNINYGMLCAMRSTMAHDVISHDLNYCILKKAGKSAFSVVFNKNSMDLMKSFQKFGIVGDIAPSNKMTSWLPSPTEQDEFNLEPYVTFAGIKKSDVSLLIPIHSSGSKRVRFKNGYRYMSQYEPSLLQIAESRCVEYDPFIVDLFTQFSPMDELVTGENYDRHIVFTDSAGKIVTLYTGLTQRFTIVATKMQQLHGTCTLRLLTLKTFGYSNISLMNGIELLKIIRAVSVLGDFPSAIWGAKPIGKSVIGGCSIASAMQIFRLYAPARMQLVLSQDSLEVPNRPPKVNYPIVVQYHKYDPTSAFKVYVEERNRKSLQVPHDIALPATLPMSYSYFGPCVSRFRAHDVFEFDGMTLPELLEFKQQYEWNNHWSTATVLEPVDIRRVVQEYPRHIISKWHTVLANARVNCSLSLY